MSVCRRPLQAEANRPAAAVGPPPPLLEAPSQQPAQGAGQCSQLGLGQHGSHSLPAAPVAPPPGSHRSGDAGLKVPEDLQLVEVGQHQYLVCHSTVRVCVSSRFADTEVRRVAVSWIQESSDDELADYLPQLVQVRSDPSGRCFLQMSVLPHHGVCLCVLPGSEVRVSPEERPSHVPAF